MINFLNSHPLFTFKMFQNYVTEYLKLNPIDFTLNDNTLADIFYPWKRSSKYFHNFLYMIIILQKIIKIILEM